MVNTLALIVLLILLLLFFIIKEKREKREKRERYSTYETGSITIPNPETITYATSGVAGVSESTTGQALSAFTGNWIYKSDDCLRQEVLKVELQNSMIQLTKILNIRRWYPPLDPREPPILVRNERFSEKPPPYRIIVLGPTTLSLRSSSPTYAELPSIMSVDPANGILTYQGKKYVSTIKFKESAKTLFPNCTT
jgi:hypothetical protein